KEYGNAWNDIAAATKKQAELYKFQKFRTISSASGLARLARQIVIYVAEIQKPDSQRLSGYHDSELDELKFHLFSPAPLYKDFEETLLAESLQESKEQLGDDDPFVKAILDGHKPAEVAAQAIQGTQLADPAFRKSLVEGGEAAVASSSDPLIIL